MGLTETLRLVIDGTSKGAQKALGDLETKAKDADGKLGTFGSKMNTAANYAAGAATVLTGVIAKSVNTYESYGKELKTVQRLTGANAEQSSLITGQMKLIGGEAVNAGDAMAFYAKNLGLAQQGGGPAAATFEKYGISLTDANGQFRTSADVLIEFRDKLSEQTNEAQRASDAAAVMGRSYKNILPWFTKSKDEIAAMNDEIAGNGMVWSDEDMKRWGDAAKAQKELSFALTGIQITIARDVIPAIEPLVENFGKLLRALRPFMGVIVPLTASLWAFSGAVKAVRLVQFITGLGRSEKAAQGLFTVLRNGQALAIARTGFARLSGVVRGLPALLSSTGGMYGLIAAGIAVDSVLIYEAVKAFQAMKEAIDQAREAYANYQAQVSGPEYQPGGKYYEGFKTLPGGQTMDEINAAAAADQYKYPWWWGPGGWLSNAGVNVPGLANEGIVKARPGGTIVRLAEAGEDEVVLRRSRLQGKGGGDVNLTINIGNVHGTDDRAARSLAGQVKQILMSDMRLKMAMGRG